MTKEKTYYAGLKRRLTYQFVSNFKEKFEYERIASYLEQEIPLLLEAFRKEIQGKEEI